MSEEETKSVDQQEVAAPDGESEEAQPTQVPEKTPENIEPKEGSKEFNFARMREKIEALERRNYELNDKFEKKNAPPPEPDELSGLSKDDIITLGQAEKLADKRADKRFDKKWKEHEDAALPKRTRTQFADYDQVMTIENVKKFEQQEPGLAMACATAPNPWEATYKIIKKFVVTEEKPLTNKSEERVNENLSKPLSSNTVGRQGPLANTNLWADASKDQLYKEMMDAARQG